MIKYAKKNSDHRKIKIISDKANRENKNFDIFVTFVPYPNHFRRSKSNKIFLNLSIRKLVTTIKVKRSKSLKKPKMILMIFSSFNFNFPI